MNEVFIFGDIVQYTSFFAVFAVNSHRPSGGYIEKQRLPARDGLQLKLSGRAGRHFTRLPEALAMRPSSFSTRYCSILLDTFIVFHQRRWAGPLWVGC